MTGTIPKSLDAITPQFLEGLLGARWPGVKVAKVTVDGEIHGTATKARIIVDYTQRPDAPRVMWLKAGWEAHSEMLGKVGIYAREPRAYLELLPDLAVRAPQCFGGIYDMETLEGVVLLEDMGLLGARLNTPETVIAAPEVEQILHQLAAMHARTMSADWLDARPWLMTAFSGMDVEGTYLNFMADEDNLARFLTQPRCAGFPDAVRDPQAIRRALRRLADWAAATPLHCLLHGDAHIGNSYTLPDGTPGLLDWQCAARGGWAYDVAYYMGSTLSTDDRRLHEHALLRSYLDAMTKAGGPVLEWEQAWADYTTCLAYGFAAWLANAPEFQPEHYNAIVATRFAHAMVDHGMI